ncbi:hypothetical protein [Microvirga rosea]|uniref:hypothetical protein n=1 Tax=Microvirga rosea TaxID=2715425 RepID=UPI001D0A3632|nr:hypothetical protein [Microvirga rosea]MCB8822091.1 hypothetical protein [Microvirga rosea]
MGFPYRSGVCALALAAGAFGLQFEPVLFRDVRIDAPTHGIAVGAVRAPLWSVALAQTPDTFSLENVKLSFGGADYEAKTIQFNGVATPKADIEALFSSASAEPIATRLSRISAAQIVIPDLRLQQKLGPKTQTITYKNVVLTNIRQGRIAEAVAGAAGTEIMDGSKRTVSSYGRMTVSDIDLPAFARLYETKADSGPLTSIYGSFSVEKIDFVDGRNNTSATIERLSGRDFSARPTKNSWAGSMSLFSELGDKKDLSEDEQKRLIAAAADLFSAIGIGTVEAFGVEVKARPSNESGETVSRIKRMAFTGAKEGQPADARIEGLEVRKDDGRIGIETIAFNGFSFASTLEGLKNLENRSLKDLDAAALRSLAPTLGSMQVSGVDIDVPNAAKPGMPQRVKASLKTFEVTADQPVNAIPTNLRIALRNFAMALPENSKDEGIQNLTSLGYKAVDMSLLVSAAWNETTQELNLREVSVQGQDMGRIALTGTLGDVGKDVFNPDTALATVALIGARAKALNLVVENGGLFERYLTQAAKEQKTSPESLRRTFAAGTAVVVPSMLGSSEQARALSQALARFIAKPGRLAINARAKDSGGLGIADIVTASEPASVIQKLDITATAE